MNPGLFLRTVALLTAGLFVTALACSSEEGGALPGDTTGGMGGAGGDVGAGAAGGMAPECPHTGDPVFDPVSLPTCEGFDACRCVPSSLVPPENLDDLADCDANRKCVPDLLVQTGGNFIPKTCASVGGFEGRCLSECLPAVAEQVELLPQDTCDPGERCAPCYDPFTQEETGACSQSCDPGPTEPPGMFARCCGERGSCIGEASIPPDDASSLGQDDCMSGELCVPDGFADGTFVAEACETSLIALAGDEYRPGACLHDCLAAVDNFLILQDGCPNGFKCAPCLDPQNGGAPTGACDFLP